MSNNQNELAEFFEQQGSKVMDNGDRSTKACVEPPSITLKTSLGNTVQWHILPDGMYGACGPTVARLPVGAYRPVFHERHGVLLSAMTLLSDEIVEFPDSASIRVLHSIQKFWEHRDAFVKRGQLFKRGILLWGPPGSGKTVTINLLGRDLIERGGMILMLQNPGLATDAMQLIRRIEPERPLICILEDIDEIIREYGEHSILALLDGENQINNVVHIATSNYPELLSSRIVNRPSRFDEIIKIGMPSYNARLTYLKARVFQEELPLRQIEQWAKDTEGLSIAHLRELVIGVFCLGRTYLETLQRLKTMAQKIKSTNESTIAGFSG